MTHETRSYRTEDRRLDREGALRDIEEWLGRKRYRELRENLAAMRGEPPSLNWLRMLLSIGGIQGYPVTALYEDAFCPLIDEMRATRRDVADLREDHRDLGFGPDDYPEPVKGWVYDGWLWILEHGASGDPEADDGSRTILERSDLVGPRSELERELYLGMDWESNRGLKSGE